MEAVQTKPPAGWGKAGPERVVKPSFGPCPFSKDRSYWEHALFFGVWVWFYAPRGQTSSRRLPALQPCRPTELSKLENLLLSDPSRVRVFRKIIDRQSGKPLYKIAKFKITQITDHPYDTDKEKIYRKNHVYLKP